MDHTRAQIKEIISDRWTSKEGLNELLTLLMEFIMEKTFVRQLPCKGLSI